MKLIVVRHGQTDTNKNRNFYGGLDDALNEEGIRQVKETANIIKNYDYDIVVTPPLLRTTKTAEIINVKKKEVVLDSGFRERESGSAREGKSLYSIDYSQYWNYNNNIDYEYDDDEDLRDFVDRVKNAVEELKRECNNKTVLLVTSRGVYRALYVLQNGIPEDGHMADIDFSNGTIAEFEF